MLHRCDLISSFFGLSGAAALTSETSETRIMSLKPSDLDVLLEYNGSTWSWKTSSTYYTTFNNWMSYNTGTLKAPTNAQLNAAYKPTTNIYLTPGEVVQLLVRIGLNYSYTWQTEKDNDCIPDATTTAVSTTCGIEQFSVPSKKMSEYLTIDGPFKLGIECSSHYAKGIDMSGNYGKFKAVRNVEATNSAVRKYVKDIAYRNENWGFGDSMVLHRCYNTVAQVGWTKDQNDNFHLGYVCWSNGDKTEIVLHDTTDDIHIGLLAWRCAQTVTMQDVGDGTYKQRIYLSWDGVRVNDLKKYKMGQEFIAPAVGVWCKKITWWCKAPGPTGAGGAFAEYSVSEWYNYSLPRFNYPNSDAPVPAGFFLPKAAIQRQLLFNAAKYVGGHGVVVGGGYQQSAPGVIDPNSMVPTDNIQYDTGTSGFNITAEWSTGTWGQLRQYNGITQLNSASRLYGGVSADFYKKMKPVDWAASTVSAMVMNTVDYPNSGSQVVFGYSLSEQPDGIKISDDYAFYATITTKLLYNGDYVIGDVTTSDTPISDVLENCITDVDIFSGNAIVSGGSTTRLINTFADKYSIFDGYFAMYCDFTANSIIGDILDDVQIAFLTNSEMYNQYLPNGLDTYLPTFKTTLRELRTVEDQNNPALAAIAGLSSSLDYRNTLFTEMHNAFTSSKSVNEMLGEFKRKVNEAIARATNAATLSANPAKRALLYNAAWTQIKYDRITSVIELATSAGITTLSEAFDYVTRAVPDYGFALSDDDQIALYEDLLSQSTYAGYKANCCRKIDTVGSNVSYWRTYTQRMGSSIIGSGAPDPEFVTASDGALYLYPPVLSFYVEAESFDHIVQTYGYYFNVPLKYSYVMIYKLYPRDATSHTYCVCWCARFNGGTDSDLGRAVRSCYAEFVAIGDELAKAYVNSDAGAFTTPELPDGWTGTNISPDVTGSLALIGSMALSGVLGSFSIPDEAQKTPIGNKLKLGLKTSLPSIAIGAGVGAVLSAANVIWKDDAGTINGAYSLKNIVNTVNDASFWENVTLTGAAAINSSGHEAMATVNALFMWAVRCGVFKPIKTLDGDDVAIGYGCYSPSIVAPKYYYTGERIDYSALALTAAIAITAGYTRRYLKYEKVRTASYLPVTTSMAAASAGGSVISAIISDETAHQSDLVGLVDMVEQDVKPEIDDISTNVNSILTVVSNLMTGLDLVQGKTEDIQETLNGMKRRTYRY